MFLHAIHLRNYRGHKDLQVNFRSPFTVVAGVNGSGKTSLLQGISAGLNAFVSSIANRPYTDWFDTHTPFLRVDVFENSYRFEPQYPVHIEAKGDFSSGQEMLSSVHHDGVGAQYQGSHRFDADAALPLILFYPANRWWPPENPDVTKAAATKISRLSGYDNWQTAAADSEAFQVWVITKCLERFQRAAETGKRFDEIPDDELAMVNSALHQAIPEIAGLRYDMRQKSVLVDWLAPDQTDEPEITPVCFEHLSDGQRAALCLIADIARRACLLNPQFGQDVINKTPGLVLIDELDAHLHPKWQRLITNGLKSAFPAMQFIVTSHSPQVLGELVPEEIILLNASGAEHPQISYGLDSGQVLEIIMEAPARNQQINEKIKTLFQLIEDKNLQSAKARLAELKNEAPRVPELAGAEALIHRQEILGR